MGTAPARARLGVLLVILGFRTECSTASGTAENGVVSLRIAESRACHKGVLAYFSFSCGGYFVARSFTLLIKLFTSFDSGFARARDSNSRLASSNRPASAYITPNAR